MYDVTCPGGGIGPVGELRMMPDWNTVTPLPYSKGHARVFVDLYERDPFVPSPLCPREFLRRAMAEAAKEGLFVKTAFENEFTLFKRSADGKGYEPSDDTVFCQTFSMDLHHDLMSDIFDALTEQGIWIEAYYAESAPGQQEISMKYADPMISANQQVCREYVCII